MKNEVEDTVRQNDLSVAANQFLGLKRISLKILSILATLSLKHDNINKHN